MRVAIMPVAAPVDMEWADVDRILHQAWADSTALANWACLQLAQHDTVRTPTMERLPPSPASTLYRDFQQYERRAAWTGATQSANIILQGVDRAYRQTRIETHWRRERALRTYRYPYPYPIDADAWTARLESGRPVVELGVPGGRVSVRLRGGDEFRRQLAIFGQIVSGRALRCEASIYRQRTGSNAFRTVTDRASNGGPRVSYRIMVKMVAWVPIQPGTAGQRSGSAIVRTGAEPFLSVVLSEGGDPRVLHAPWVRNWIVEHESFLQQCADDTHHEKRWPAHRRLHLNGYRERRCEKQQRRMRSFLQETTAFVAGLAQRRRLAEVVYDDTDASFAPSFPWYQFREMLSARLTADGVVFRHINASAETVDETLGGASEDANP